MFLNCGAWANTAYPTGVSLLEKARQKAAQYLEKVKELGAKTYRTYKRTAKKIFVQYQKIRCHTIKSRKKAQKQIRQFSQRNIRQLEEAVNNVKLSIKNTGLEAINSADKAKKQFIEKAQEPLDTANNASDSQLLDTSLKGYKGRFGFFPTQLAADRGFWPKENRQLAENYNIKKIAIENKGKSSYLKGKPFRGRLRRLRCPIEAKISLAKRKYGLSRACYNIQNGEEIWVRLGLIAMNLKTSVGYG